MSTENAVYLQSLGAAETVTGSKHLLQTPGFKLLIDCGLFQGLKTLRERNWEPLPIDASSIDAIILTHAHLDHCGYLPLLVKNGYKGKIYMSKPTRDLTEIVLRDTAKLQEEDAEKANRHGYSKHHPAKPLYDTGDVEAVLPHFVTVELNERYTLNDYISFRFFTAGHIPGACSAKVICYGKTIVFSGDIGRTHSELLHTPTHPKEADYVVMESTYGDRLHPKEDTGEALARIVNETLERHGNILIPCFAVGRAQDIIHILYRLTQQHKIPAWVPVYLDSPMAAAASKVLQKYPDWLTISENECDAMFRGITINQDYQGTEEIINQKGSKIVLAGSGMITGGRILEYLKQDIGNPDSTIVLVGYQAEGTRGRALMNQTHELKMHGRFFPVEIQVSEITGLSGHADQGELMHWLSSFQNKPKRVFLVHGEPCAMEALRVKIQSQEHLDVSILKQDRPEFLFNTDSR
ncbi:MAG TPA: MBL fold metallo-hydrolase [Mucilaginibacter sp.]|nr:MBL fold metallo-hydrolase [Mucilaginibacter sp.]